jgi:ATP-dependent Clp endopeptidase proteolytic subunit ClpP
MLTTMKHSIQVQARGPSQAEVLIFSPIGEGFFGDGLTAARFDETLKALGDVKDILVRINSPGGAVWDGFAIYNTLKNHPARIHVQIDGLAASIASVIAMAGDRIEMGEGTMLMIHDPWSLAMGDADDMRAAADMLDKVKVGIVQAYASRTGISQGRILKMMEAETWFTADEAVDQKFADSFVDKPEQPARIAAADFRAVFAQFKAPTNSHQRNPTMDLDPNTPAAVVTPEATLAQEAARRAAIRMSFGRYSDKHRPLLDECLDDMTCTIDLARTKLLAKLSEGVEPLNLGHGQLNFSHASPDQSFVIAAADGLLMRAGIPQTGVHPAAHDTMALSLHDLARTCLAQGGKSNGYLSGQRLVKAAMSTSDFPAILENALNKAIRRGYETEPASHRLWVRVQPVNDFKEQSRPILGSAPALESVPELGEYTHGSMVDDKASYKVEKFGRIVSLSWEALVNDDLGAFLRVQPALGQAARRKEADIVYSLITENAGTGQTMQDSVVLFHADHNNIATAGALSATTLGAARALLRKQTALGGGLLSLVPRFLIVGADLETDAEILLASATRHIATGTEAAQPEWIGHLQLVVEPRLDDSAFYLAANTEQIDTVELGILDADGLAPTVEEEDTFDVDARRWKVRHVFGARFLDWRGMIKVPAA